MKFPLAQRREIGQQLISYIMGGATDEQALLMGLLNGSFEALFEKVSLDKLIQGNPVHTIRQFFTEMAKQGFVEGSEELFTTFANTAADILVMGDNSELLRAAAGNSDTAFL